MPTIVRTFMCDYCTLVFEDERSCLIHERTHDTVTDEAEYKAQRTIVTQTPDAINTEANAQSTDAESGQFNIEDMQVSLINDTTNHHHMVTRKRAAEEIDEDRESLTPPSIATVRVIENSTVPFTVDNFQCQYCGKEFYARSRLERHERSHTGERPFQCSICHKNFARKDGLKGHMLSKHEVEMTSSSGTSKNLKFKCKVCGKGFRDNYHLARHEVVHHRTNKKTNEDDALSAISQDFCTVDDHESQDGHSVVASTDSAYYS